MHYWLMKKTSIEKIIADNINLLMSSNKNLNSQQKLAAKSGVGQTTVGRILRNDVSPTVDSLAKIARALNVSMFELMDPTLATTSLYDNKIAEEKSRYMVSGGPGYAKKTPLISWEDVTRFDITDDGIINGAKPVEFVDCPFPHGVRAFCVKVLGDAMTPFYLDGDVVCVDMDVNPGHLDDVFAINNEYGMIRVYHSIPEGKFLVASNPSWAQQFVKITNDIKVLGTVIGSWRNQRESGE